MVKKNLFNPTGLMLLYSILMLSQFDRVVGLMPEQLVKLLSFNMSVMAIVTEIVAFAPPVLFFWLLLRKRGERAGWVSFVPFRFWPFIGSVALWVPVAALIVNIGVFMGVDNGLVDPLLSVVPNLNIFATCIVPAILEELFMRGSILTSVGKGGKSFAIFFSSVCFAMLHGNMHNFLGPFLAGLIFAIMTVLTGSVVPAIVAHFINNAFSSYASTVILKISSQISMEIILFTIIVVFLLLTYVALSQYQNILLYEEAEEKKIDSKERQGTIFATLSSIPVLGFILFFFYNAGMIFGPL